MTTGTVEESNKGNMPNKEEQAKVASSKEGKTPEVVSKVSSEEKPEEPIYTQKQVDLLIHAAKSDTGRSLRDVEKERDDLKAQIASKENEIEDIKSERETLNKQIDDLSGDDPKKFDLVQKERDLRDRETKLKNERRDLDTEKQANADIVKLAKETMSEIEIWETASLYEGGDPVKLKDMCETLGANTEEQRKKIAGTLWKPKPVESNESDDKELRPYSGTTKGGALDTSSMSADDKISYGINQLKKKK